MSVLVCGATVQACSSEPADRRAGVVCTVVSEEQPSALIVTIVGEGSCAPGVAATLEVNNTTGGRCGSDILASVHPGDHPMWFASTSGAGGATGRWEVRPANTEGVGVMEYPAGRKTWPIALPPLGPGTYTFSVPGVACGAGNQAFEATFQISSITS